MSGKQAYFILFKIRMISVISVLMKKGLEFEEETEVFGSSQNWNHLGCLEDLTIVNIPLHSKHIFYWPGHTEK